LIHSRYERFLADLPAHGRRVQLRVQVRRFRCAWVGCNQKIFAERLDPSVARPFGRRTGRLEGIVHHIGLALGGRPGQRTAARLLLPVSKDTLLRVVRDRAAATTPQPRVIGIDDWAWRKGHRYGTVVCDLERRRIIDALADRETATVQAWLAARPSIEFIARDRGGGYGLAATRGRPEARQVADRWHLMENSSAAFLTAVRRSMPDIRKAIGSQPIDPALLTAAERAQYEGWRQRAAADATVLQLHAAGAPIKEIVRRTGRARKVVRDIVRGGRTEPFRPRASLLEPHLEWLSAEWEGGCRNGAELWRRLRARGFSGSLRVVTEWATRRRRDEVAGAPRRCASARSLARMMTLARDRLSRSELATVAVVEHAIPGLVLARDLVDRFQSLIRKRNADALDPWIDDAAQSMISSFAKGLADDRPAVVAAIEEPWSNGQTEGQITKLKLVKRQMYGRANLDLLRARLICVA
jgi:transposase